MESKWGVLLSAVEPFGFIVDFPLQITWIVDGSKQGPISTCEFGKDSTFTDNGISIGSTIG